MRFGALEAGGTKMVCAVGTEDGDIWSYYDDAKTGVARV